MTILIIVGVILAILLIIFIAAAMSANHYSIASEIVINKPVDEVFDYIKYLSNHRYYNKWVMMDPDVRQEFSGEDGTEGFFYAWDSDNKQVGKGEQVIKKIVGNKLVEYDLHFIKPFENRAESYIATSAVSPNQTNVVWGLKGKRNFMMKVMHIVLNVKKMLARDLLTSLNNLKSLLEKN